MPEKHGFETDIRGINPRFVITDEWGDEADIWRGCDLPDFVRRQRAAALVMWFGLGLLAGLILGAGLLAGLIEAFRVAP